MRQLGILGGMSWESTASYYRLLNQGVREQLGGLHSAPLLLHSVDFAEVAELQQRGDWQAAGELLARAAQGLQQAGATALLLATNTMHKVAPALEAAIDIPLLHIGDAVGQALQRQGIKRAALLGTRFTMQEAFYRQRLAERFAIEVITPEPVHMEEVDRVIFAELCQGQFLAPARDFYLDCLRTLKEQGAEVAILGCTEIGLLLEGVDAPLPLLDSAELHVAMGLEWMLGV
ncbi:MULTISPECIES: aspartate/glutamate racemase family protein [Pseudomonas]|uniref:Aspartate/glutamate racemase family protein n=1 Tax=Pseudomonas spirodelae TaxID=3101751 RepID=A0ABU5PAK9_9PSED|nr:MULTISPECIES: aspartate/glutamate racemase family protein [unclassified Pseudomonas]MBU0900455.1 aspartate/glutamate racemase family protein [Gammaproteobacteria bacterium]MDD2162004.1 aspartate/glutamate racemase family protein [Pseudomonas sp. MIL19]MEA1606563.1 aspartate/glutamate racemase family protein [Pseudomonas sp. T5W1]